MRKTERIPDMQDSAGEPARRLDDTAAHEPDARPISQAEIDRRLTEIGYKLEDHNAHLIRLAHQRATALFQKAFEGYSVTPTQSAVLATLLRYGAMSQNNLGRLTAIDTATLSPMMRRLQDFGFIERIPSDEDQRVNLVKLTEKGVDFALEVLPIAKRVSDEVLAPLKPRDRQRFLEMLSLLR
jgi:DNA-binding MarR family transcriptional regulator